MYMSAMLQYFDLLPCPLQVMSPYQMVWQSIWTLTSMERALSWPSPVPPLVALLPLSLGPETLKQSQEGWLCWMTLWLHSTPIPWLWLGDWKGSTIVPCPTINHQQPQLTSQYKVTCTYISAWAQPYPDQPDSAMHGWWILCLVGCFLFFKYICLWLVGVASQDQLCANVHVSLYAHEKMYTAKT